MTFKSAMQTDYKLINAMEYPHNLMRNVARQGALTEFVMSIDLGIQGGLKSFPKFRFFYEHFGLEFFNFYIQIFHILRSLPSQNLRRQFVKFAAKNDY